MSDLYYFFRNGWSGNNSSFGCAHECHTRTTRTLAGCFTRQTWRFWRCFTAFSFFRTFTRFSNTSFRRYECFGTCHAIGSDTKYTIWRSNSRLRKRTCFPRLACFWTCGGRTASMASWYGKGTDFRWFCCLRRRRTSSSPSLTRTAFGSGCWG